MRKVCVIGHPVSHSRSPLIHGYWLKKYAINGSYEKRDVPPDELGSFVRKLPSSAYVGCNITIPHKEAAVSFVNHLSDRSVMIRSVNTVHVSDGRTYGTSTDGEGFYQNLLTNIPGFSALGKTAVVVGAGGTSNAIIGQLIEQGIRKIYIFNRTVSKVLELQKRFGSTVTPVTHESLTAQFATTDLLVNTSAQGMNGQNDIELPLTCLPLSCAVADIVYVPLKTKLIRDAEVLGLRTVPGLGMLLHQAVPGFELWFGVRPEVTQDLYNLVADDLVAAAP
jgi:shikimate dehydrogenase